jgi:hypothetical protein
VHFVSYRSSRMFFFRALYDPCLPFTVEACGWLSLAWHCGKALDPCTRGRRYCLRPTDRSNPGQAGLKVACSQTTSKRAVQVGTTSGANSYLSSSARSTGDRIHVLGRKASHAFPPVSLSWRRTWGRGRQKWIDGAGHGVMYVNKAPCKKPEAPRLQVIPRE